MGSWLLKSIVERKKLKKVSSNDKHRGWASLWKSSSSHIEQGSGPRDLPQTVPVISGNGLLCTGKIRNDACVSEEEAAILIQTAFRGFLARRALRALKGLARLQNTMNGETVHKHSTANLRQIRKFVRIQAQIHGQRAFRKQIMSKLPEKLPRNAAAAVCTKETEADWCDATGTLEEIQARVRQREEAAIKRERALAYAFSNQWRMNAKFNSEYFFDYELDNSTWSWIWLDRWISGVNHENHTFKERAKQSSQTAAEERDPRKKNVLKVRTSRAVKATNTSKSMGSGEASPGESIHHDTVSVVKKSINGPSKRSVNSELEKSEAIN